MYFLIMFYHATTAVWSDGAEARVFRGFSKGSCRIDLKMAISLNVHTLMGFISDVSLVVSF